MNLPLLTDELPVESERVEPELKRQCVDDYEILLSVTDVAMNFREALQSTNAEQWIEAIF